MSQPLLISTPEKWLALRYHSAREPRSHSRHCMPHCSIILIPRSFIRIMGRNTLHTHLSTRLLHSAFSFLAPIRGVPGRMATKNHSMTSLKWSWEIPSDFLLLVSWFQKFTEQSGNTTMSGYTPLSRCHPVSLQNDSRRVLYIHSQCQKKGVHFTVSKERGPLHLKKSLDFRETINQNLFVFMQNHEVIGVSHIAAHPQFVLDELIEHVQIHICEQLRGQISKGQTGAKTLNDFPKELRKAFVRSPCCKNVQKNFMINGVEKLFYIQLQKPQSSRVIMRQLETKILQSSYRCMSALSFSGRPRIKNKYFIPCRFNDPVDGVMEQAIPDRSFMDMTTLRIVNDKRDIATVFVCSVFEIFVQRKNMIFKIDLKFRYIIFVALLFFELRPSVEQVLQRNYFIKHTYGK